MYGYTKYQWYSINSKQIYSSQLDWISYAKICSLTPQLIYHCRLALISKLMRQAKRQHTSGNQKHDVATQCNREGMCIDGNVIASSENVVKNTA